MANISAYVRKYHTVYRVHTLTDVCTQTGFCRGQETPVVKRFSSMASYRCTATLRTDSSIYQSAGVPDRVPKHGGLWTDSYKDLSLSCSIAYCVALSLILQVLLLLLPAGWPARTYREPFFCFCYSPSVRFVCFGFESLEDAGVSSTGELPRRREAEGTRCTTTTTTAAAGTSLGKLPPTAPHADGNNMCLGSMHYSLHRSYRESYRGA